MPSYKDVSSSDSEDEYLDVDSSFNQSLAEDNTVEGQIRGIKNKNLEGKTQEVSKLLENCKLDGSTVVYVDSDDDNGVLEEVVEEGHIVEQPEPLKVSNMPEDDAPQNFDIENGQDGDKAADTARSIKLEFEPNDIRFWFAQLEDEMTMATVKSQWLKKTVLQRNLPLKQKEDVKSYLTLQKAEAGANIYFDIKTELIRIYAPKPSDSYRKALTRTMTGLPSQLGYQIINDICKKPSKLSGCCCAGATLALWSIQLPISVRAHVSQKEFTKDTYKEVFQDADKVFLASKQVSVSAIQVAAVAASLDETLPAFNQQNQPAPELAALAKKAKKANGGGGSGGGGAQKNSNNKNSRRTKRGPKHSSVPDSLGDKMCDRHFTHGAGAWYCLAPSSCPWKDKCTPKQ